MRRRFRRQFVYRAPVEVAMAQPSVEGATYRQHFGDWWSYLDAIKPAAASALRNGSRDPGHTSWAGGTFDQVHDLARGGWAEGTARMAGMAQTLTDKLASTLPRDEWTYDVTGAILDVGRFCAGEPEHWVNPEPKLVKSAGQPMTIVFGGFVSAGVSDEAIFWRGASVATLVRLAEMMGRPTQVLVHYFYQQHGCIDHVSIVVKDFGDALDVDRLAFVLAHPGSFRRLGFAAWELAPDHIRQACGIHEGGGYGVKQELPIEDRGDVYVKSLCYNEGIQTERAATAWVTEQLVEQGIIATDEVAA